MQVLLGSVMQAKPTVLGAIPEQSLNAQQSAAVMQTLTQPDRSGGAQHTRGFPCVSSPQLVDELQMLPYPLGQADMFMHVPLFVGTVSEAQQAISVEQAQTTVPPHPSGKGPHPFGYDVQV